MTVSVILPTVRTTTVGTAIDAIRAQDVDDWELVVVFQGDDPDLHALVRGAESRDGRIRGVHTARANLSHARNLGMAAATGELFAFTDDDCEVAADWVRTLTQTFAASPGVGIVGGEVVAQPRTSRFRISTCPAAHVSEARYDPTTDAEAPVGFYMIGANFAASRVVWETIGRFDEVLGAGARFACCEDQDFMFRAAAAGFSLATTPRAVVYHSSGRRDGLDAFSKHQRNYARGRGAWIAKLRQWGHPLGDVWSRPAGLAESAQRLVREPHRWLLDRYAGPHARRAMEEYDREFVLDESALSISREERAPGQTSARWRQLAR